MSFIGTRAPLGRAASTFNFFIGAVGVGLLAWATFAGGPFVTGPELSSVDGVALGVTFLALFIFARVMRFEVPPNITASLVVPLQIASILLLGPVPTAWLALPAFLAEAAKHRALHGLQGERRRAMLGIIAFNLGMEALMTLAGGATWAALRPAGDERATAAWLAALVATFVVFKAVNEVLMLAGSWLRGTEVRLYLEGARTTVLIETLTLPLASLMVAIHGGLPRIDFYIFVAGTILAAVLVRGLTRARVGLAAANADLQRKVREIEALARIGQAISADIELESLLDTIYHRCRDILVANHFFVALYTEGESRLQIAFEIIAGDPQPPKDIPLGEGLTSHVILTRAPLLVQDLEGQREALPVPPLYHPADEEPNRSWLGVPMVARGETVGAIVLQEKSAGAYDEDDLRVLSAIASQAAISVKNARLHREALHALRVEAENRQLKRLNAKKSEFVNMVAHQFRTPLTAVIGYANLLVERVQKRGAADVPDLERHLRTVHGESRRLADMVEELLNLSRIRSGRFPLTMQRFDLVLVVRETIAAHQLLAEARSLRVDLSPEVESLEVDGDSNFVRNAFANVLANALKYAPEGSRISVAVTPHEDSALVEVVDEGPGVRPGDIERIFDEFYRAPGVTAEHPGTGLGLSICRGIVEAHGGRSWAEARGAGTAFAFTIPLVASASFGEEREDGEPVAGRVDAGRG